jgi:hypothetical protein
MTTVEEHIAGLRAAGEKMPPQFLRAGLIYEFFPEVNAYYYEPAEPFEVDGITYRYDGTGQSGRAMLEIYNDGHGLADLRCSRPMTEEELDRWTHDGNSAALNLRR